MIAQMGWDLEWQKAWDGAPRVTVGALPGRVVRVERTTISVAVGESIVSIHATGFAVGDWVTTDGLTWADPLPRRTQLTRQNTDRTSNEQVLAANVDAVLIVEPSHPEPNLRRIERMLTLAWASGALPIVVLTKNDLAERDWVGEVKSVAFGVDVVSVSSTTGSNLDAIAALIEPEQTFVLIGPSGAGKSSLVNSLAGHEVLATGEIRSDGKGRHTTTRRELITIIGLGSLIDTPGIRAVGMTADEVGLDATFTDVIDLAQQCRFGDCLHTAEPGCAVTEAVEVGLLDSRRLENYKRIEREIQHQTQRRETGSRHEERLDTKGRRTAKRVVMDAKGRSGGR